MGDWETYLMERRKLGEGTGMEESGKEISMREYPLSRRDNRTAAVADSTYECLLLEWSVEDSFYVTQYSTIRIGEGPTRRDRYDGTDTMVLIVVEVTWFRWQ